MGISPPWATRTGRANKRTLKKFTNLRYPTPRMEPVDGARSFGGGCCRACWHGFWRVTTPAILSLARTRATYLLTTTFSGTEENRQLVGIFDWKPLKLVHDPFNFHPPVARITEGSADWVGEGRVKSPGLWRLADIP